LDKETSNDFVQSCDNYGLYYGRLHDQQLTIEILQVKLSENDEFDQLYCIAFNGKIDLIYPF
jgi:hypothetical protein